MNRLKTRVWFALCLSLLLVGVQAQGLEGEALDNVAAFTKLLGYVRYFHPSDAVADADWESFAIGTIEQVETAASAEVLADKLEALFKPYAPTLSVYPTGETPETILKRPAEATYATFWVHVPLGDYGNDNLLAKGERLRVPLTGDSLPETVTFSGGIRQFPYPLNLEVPYAPYTANLPGGVTVTFPLVLFADASGTLPAINPPEPTRVRFRSGDDRATRLASIALLWSSLQHFFVYWDVVTTDWDAALRSALAEAATDENAADFSTTLERLGAGLKDGHTQTRHPEFSGHRGYAVPFTADLINGELVVTTVSPEASVAIAPGDVLVEIDGVPALEALEKALELESGVGQWRRWKAVQRLLQRDAPIPLDVTVRVRTTGEVRELNVATARANLTNPNEPRPPEAARLSESIVYLDLTRLQDVSIDDYVDELRAADGIVFDMRGYPGQLAFDLLSYLSSKRLRTAPFLLPVVTRPDHQAIQFVEVTRTWGQGTATPLHNFVFITDGRAISYAESILGIVEGYGLGEIIGQPTAGANGNRVDFELPGGYKMSWTGLKVTKFDGSPLFTVGITPTIPVVRTPEGVAAGRDELLEKAFEVVSGLEASAMKVAPLETP